MLVHILFLQEYEKPAIELFERLHGSALAALEAVDFWDFEQIRAAVKPHLSLLEVLAWKKTSVSMDWNKPRLNLNHC